MASLKSGVATPQTNLEELKKQTTNATSKDIIDIFVKNDFFKTIQDAQKLNQKALQDITASISQSGNTQEALSILESLATSSLASSDILGVITNQNFFKEIRTQGQEAIQTSNTSNQLGAINIANDMAIGDRVARFNNPYMETKRFAALGSDVAYSYLNFI